MAADRKAALHQATYLIHAPYENLAAAHLEVVAELERLRALAWDVINHPYPDRIEAISDFLERTKP